MRVILQRVSNAAVTIDRGERRSIGAGFVALLGVTHGDGEREMQVLADKLLALRVFEDGDGKMNLSLADVGGDLLIVPNFTLYADCKKGRRPSFVNAAPPEQANELYMRFVTYLRERAPAAVQTGSFGADMQVDIVNDGPVTIILDTAELL